MQPSKRGGEPVAVLDDTSRHGNRHIAAFTVPGEVVVQLSHLVGIPLLDRFQLVLPGGGVDVFAGVLDPRPPHIHGDRTFQHVELFAVGVRYF